jgi:hypothetical protein
MKKKFRKLETKIREYGNAKFSGILEIKKRNE